MTSGKLVSVIVPVYNAVATLERCIHSILNQTYHNLEIIMVDDASTDSSREMMLKLEQTDPERIMVICNDVNLGAGGARNIALEYANGDYLAFVDSDDYVHSSFIKLLVEEIERGGHDFVDCGYFDERKDDAILHTKRDTRGELSDEAKCKLIAEGGYLCTKLFKRELFYDNGIRYREKCILEDLELLIELTAYAKSIGAVEETLYWYTATPNSSSQSQPTPAYVQNMYDAMKAAIGLKERIPNYESLRPGIEYVIIQMYTYGVIRTLNDYNKEHVLDTLYELKRLRDLRVNGVTKGYNNKYVRERITKLDLKLVELNDKAPDKLVKNYKWILTGEKK